MKNTDDLTQRAQQLYPASPSYRAAWLRSVQLLGSKWLLAANATPRPKEH